MTREGLAIAINPPRAGPLWPARAPPVDEWTPVGADPPAPRPHARRGAARARECGRRSVFHAPPPHTHTQHADHTSSH